MRLLFATGNEDKVREAREILEPKGVKVEHLEIDYPEPQVDDLETVAREGVRYVFRKTGEPVFVEDSGLFVDALNGFPGPYSAYVHGTLGNGGLLKLMEGIRDRRATFRSVVAFCDGPGVSVHVGEVEGEIAGERRGTAGFGYDPVFIPEGTGSTFAEDPEGKSAVSHRRRALDSFAEWMGPSRA
ncbi:MAG: dITP/XTP pyrophosphatase [Methanonatronarchaeales archaeon]|nr:dITP/XTP pyrophosphatase [Methanonatronarchaeales archaeon]